MAVSIITADERLARRLEAFSFVSFLGEETKL